MKIGTGESSSNDLLAQVMSPAGENRIALEQFTGVSALADQTCSDRGLLRSITSSLIEQGMQQLREARKRAPCQAWSTWWVARIIAIGLVALQPSTKQAQSAEMEARRRRRDSLGKNLESRGAG